MTVSSERSGWWRCVSRIGAACLPLALPVAATADSGSLAIELNKVESGDDGCRTLFVFDNRTGYELHRFRVDLILFDPKGVYKEQLLLDMAPLYAEKKTVGSFLLEGQSCDTIGSILVNGIPQCQNGAGDAIRCVEMLKVESRSEIPLEK